MDAAGCLSLDLLFGEDQAVVNKTVFVIDALVYRRNLTLGCVVGIDSDVVLVQRLEVTAVSCESLGYVVLRYEAA